MRIRVFFITIFLIFVSQSFPQLSKVLNKADYPFWLYLPADSIMQNNPPVLIFLHGKSLSGNNLNNVRRYGVINAIEKGLNMPAIVIAPQVRRGQSWIPSRIMTTLKYVMENYNIDTNRIYVAGMSLGGSGTYLFASRYPEIIAGAVAMCGRGNSSDMCKLASLNLWIHHGKKDIDVPLSESTKIVNAIKRCNKNANLEFTVHENYGHNEIARLFYKDEIYNWLFQFTKNKKETDITPQSLKLNRAE
jgi:predicted peptidase